VQKLDSIVVLKTVAVCSNQTIVTRRAREERESMDEVTSRDGTPIAFDRLGDGPPVIVVCGAMCDRALMRPTAEELAKHFTVFNYDRRGRGDSRDTTPYAVEREIEDIGALVAEAGGTASVYGHSSGAGLVLHAAAHGLPIAKIVLHDPPYAPDGEEEAQRSSREYGENLKAMLSDDRRGDAVELFMTLVGMPQEMIEGMRHTPRWAGLEAMAPTLAYDSEVMGDIGRDGTIPVDKASRVRVPALVLTGGADYPWMTDVGRRLADAMPNGRHRVLENQEHVVPPEVLVPVLAEFFAD
jgi:pimeloyl-ACP methyl ester carboxylesterase